MAYNPYEVNRIMGQVGDQLLGAGHLGLRRREVEMQESLHPLQRKMLVNELRQNPVKMRILQEKIKQDQMEGMKKMLNLTSMFEARGYKKEQYWPVMQKIMPRELGEYDAKDVAISRGGGGVIYSNKNTGLVIESYIDPETGEIKVEKSKDPSVDPSSLYVAKRIEEAETPEEKKKWENIINTARTPRIVTDTKTKKRYSVSQTGELTDLGIEGIVQKPLPTQIQSDLSQNVVSFDAIDKIEEVLPRIVNAPILGYGAKGMAKIGKKDYVDFETEVNNLKLQAQALIKGIPSNFDVQTVINTLPSLNETDATNISRLNKTKSILKSLITDTVGYYKGLHYQIPQSIIDGAVKHGVDIDSIQPWDNEKVDIVTRFNNDPEMKNSRLGKQTPQGYEVFDDQGNLMGYYD